MTTELHLIPEHNPTSRFKLTNLPLVTPGKCACCGAVDRPVVDFDMTVQFYGAVLLCITCLAEAARLIDMTDGANVRTAELSATLSLSTQLAQLGMRTITDEQFDCVLNAFDELNSIIDAIDPIPSEVEQKHCEGQERLFELDRDAAAGSGSVIEFPDSVLEQDSDLAISEGPNSVPASASDGDDFFKL